jgi:ADP-heptose:LPS heptosyltransferase
MRRYQGEELPSGSAIAVVANDAIGNFVITSPLAQMLAARHRPARLDLFSGSRAMELAAASPLWTHSFAPFGAAPSDATGPLPSGLPTYDLVVNVEWAPWAKALAGRLSESRTLVCGPATGADGVDLPFGTDARAALWNDRAWIAPDLAQRYPFLRTGWIGEIFCRLAYLDGDVPPYRVPESDPAPALAQRGQDAVPDVLVACSASLPEKLWPFESWEQALVAVRDGGFRAGLLGAPRRNQGAFWQGADAEDRLVDAGLVSDLRGAFTLPQVVGALARARAVLTLDNGIMHLAAAARTPTVALFREGIHRLWSPPSDRLHAIVPDAGAPVLAIPAQAVTEALAKLLR